MGFLQISSSCSRCIFQDVDPHLFPEDGRIWSECHRRLVLSLGSRMHLQDRTPGSILESNTLGFLSLYLEIPLQHWRLKYAAYFIGVPGKWSSSATCIFTAIFEPKIQHSSGSSGQSCGSSLTLDEAFYFTFWTSWRKHTDILFASWVYLKQR